MIDRVATDNLRENPLASYQMDKDWYYRWLLFSNLQQHQDWQQRLLSSQTLGAHSMLMEEAQICGLCGASETIDRSPSTFPRLLQALDLSKLPPLLTEDDLRKRVGLCNKCEGKIKLLEEASNIRSNLKESFIGRLKHLSGEFILYVTVY